LAVIATDIDRGQMVVYSSQTHPDLEIAEAVRRSMSIPFVFQPRGSNKQMVDGGLCSNFPIWLYSVAGNPYWPPASIDAQRVKIGFTLDETKATPPAWAVQPPRFDLSGNPPNVDLLEVVRPILIEKLVEVGVPRELAETDITWAIVGDATAGANSGPGIELIQEILGTTLRGVMNTEETTRQAMITGLMAGLRYIDVPIPLLGYHGLDFFLNEDERALMAMWDRAWRKAFEGLSNAVAQGTLLTPGFTLSATQTPFN
jgi:hypothetical protein